MANINFNTTNSTFRQLMGNGLAYRVPPFQRDYSWTADEWDDLWQDILGLFAEDREPAHYMGYLVLQSSDNKFFDIIDGQQRMTTLTLMVLAAISHLLDLAEGEGDNLDARRAEQLRNAYVGYLDPVTLIPHSKLTLNRHNDRYYQDYMVPLEKLPMRGLNASEHLLRKAFDWFKLRISEYAEGAGEMVARLVDSVVDRLFFTVITVTDELNAFKVFETLNSRGVRLSSTDLLKNFLFSVVHGAGVHESELETLEERWEAIVGLLGSESFPEFLRVFWNSRNPLVRKSDLFKTIRRAVTSKADAFQLIRELDQCARIYSALRNPDDGMWSAEDRQQLELLRLFNVRQPLAMLLAAHEVLGDDPPGGFSRILKAIAIVSFRYNVVCGLQANEQERVYNGVARGISDGTLHSARSVVTALKPVYPEDRTFSAAFADKEFRTTSSRNKNVVRYILGELERGVSGSAFDLESAQYNIEHILPENPGDAWEEFGEAEHERYVYRLGNMVLLGSKANRGLGNAPFVEKRSAYEKSEFQVTCKVANEYDAWTPAKVSSQQSWMANQAKSIWRISF
jgi:hypothetical protein